MCRRFGAGSYGPRRHSEILTGSKIGGHAGPAGPAVSVKLGSWVREERLDATSPWTSFPG